MNITEENSANIIQQWIKEIPPYDDKFEGTGIIMIAGGIKYYTNAYCSIRLLREKGCKLPIQVWHLGEKESIPEIERELEKYDVECIDAYKFMKDNNISHNKPGGWEMKPWVMAHCKFKHILLLDADVFCDCDPTYIFDSKEYRECNAIYMPDYGIMEEDRSFWKVLGLKYEKCQEFESGIIFLNKEKCWKSINLAAKICEYGIEFFFHHFYGDKQSFYAAHRLVGEPYYQEPTPIRTLSGTMVQHTQGVPLFYHRNQKKLNLLKNDKVRHFANEELIFSYLDELKQIWNPYFKGESIDGKWMYHRVGYDSRQIEIKDNIIIKGDAKLEKYIGKIDDETTIYDEGGAITAKLKRFDFGWIGRWEKYEKMIVILEKK